MAPGGPVVTIGPKSCSAALTGAWLVMKSGKPRGLAWRIALHSQLLSEWPRAWRRQYWQIAHPRPIKRTIPISPAAGPRAPWTPKFNPPSGPLPLVNRHRAIDDPHVNGGGDPLPLMGDYTNPILKRPQPRR